MTNKIIETLTDVETADELVSSLNKLDEIANDDPDCEGLAVCYVRLADGTPVKSVSLHKIELTDGSYIFDIVLDFGE